MEKGIYCIICSLLFSLQGQLYKLIISGSEIGICHISGAGIILNPFHFRASYVQLLNVAHILNKCCSVDLEGWLNKRIQH